MGLSSLGALGSRSVGGDWLWSPTELWAHTVSVLSGAVALRWPLGIAPRLPLAQGWAWLLPLCPLHQQAQSPRPPCLPVPTFTVVLPAASPVSPGPEPSSGPSCLLWPHSAAPLLQ